MERKIRLLTFFLLSFFSVVLSQTTARPPTNNNNAGAGIPTKALLDIINGERSKNGLKELFHCQLLDGVAQKNALGFAQNGSIQGTAALQNLKRSGYKYLIATELSAQGQTTPIQVFLAWMKSGQHRQLVMNPNASQIGLGHVPGANPNSNLWTAILSKPKKGVHCFITPKNNGNDSVDPNNYYQHSVPSQFFVYAKIKGEKVFFRWPEIPNTIQHEMFYSLNGGGFKSFGKVPSTHSRCKVKGLVSGWRWSLQMTVTTTTATYISQPVCVTDMRFVQCPEFY